MNAYIPIVACVLIAGIIFMMWRDISTLKSRVTDVVTQHNNVKSVLDRHESMINTPVGHEFPLQFAMDVPETGGALVEADTPKIKEEPVDEQKPKSTKKPKAT